MTLSRRGGVRQGNGLKKTGGTRSSIEMLEPVHGAAPYAFRPTTTGRGGASPRVPFPIISRPVHEGSNNAFRRLWQPGAGNLPCPPLAHLPVAVFNEVTQTFGPCVKNRLTEADGAGSGGATLGIMLLGTRAQG